MTAAAIDMNAFSEMKELMDETFEEIVKMTLQTLPEQLAGIKTAITASDVESLFNISHKMKSSCGSIGARGLAEKAEAIELISRQGSTEIPEQMLTELDQATAEVLTFLRRNWIIYNHPDEKIFRSATDN